MFPAEFKDSMVTETTRAPVEIGSRRCYQGGNAVPGEAKLPEYWPCRDLSEMLLAEFKGSRVTETARAPIETGSRRCYQGGNTVPGEAKCDTLGV